ncbi:MAG: tyrosine-type recombinase/integrase [Pseudomonadota bacterium]|nr:tyrosine-type recombinase/integrase [Pseudomonadota bacterium]
MKLTKTRIDGFIYQGPPPRRDVRWDEAVTGFGIRIYPSGKKSFVLSYRLHGRKRLFTIAQFGALTLEEARKRAQRCLAGITDDEKPVDPLDVREKARTGETVNDLATEYLEKHAKAKKKSWREDRRILEKDVLPKLGARKAKDIKRRDIIVLIDGIAERAPITANRTLEIVRKMFNFGLEKDLLEASPCVMIKAPATENSRDRVLSDDEIRTFCEKISETDITRPLQIALLLELATAQRRGEITGAKWEEFDLRRAWWTLPAERSKNGLAHRVPLSGMALALLRELEALTGEHDYLFPNPSKDRPVTDKAPTRAVGRNRDVFGIPHFTPHDLRRTAASHMASAGIQRLVIGKVLNHAERGVTATYDRHAYDKEKRQALNIWARKLERIIQPSSEKVVAIHA